MLVFDSSVFGVKRSTAACRCCIHGAETCLRWRRQLPAGCPDTPLSPERLGRCSSRFPPWSRWHPRTRSSTYPHLPASCSPHSPALASPYWRSPRTEIRGIHLPGERTHLGDGCPQIRRQSHHQEPRSSAAHMGDFQTRKWVRRCLSLRNKQTNQKPLIFIQCFKDLELKRRMCGAPGGANSFSFV